MSKITTTPRGKSGERAVMTVRTQTTAAPRASKWWAEASPVEQSKALLSTASFLKEQLNYRFRQAAVFSRLYSNQPMFGPVGSSLNRIGTANQLPMDRPTFNVVQSCIDTLVSRLTQSRPRPVFLTDGGDYKSRKLAKQMNSFIQGEFHECGVYQLGEVLLRDASVLGTACAQIYASQDNKICVERVLITELMVDPNDGLYGDPRQLYRLKLIDRSVLMEMFPDKKEYIATAEQAFPEATSSEKSISDQVMVVEGWHLPSGPGAGDGKHTIACTGSPLPLFEEDWDKETFPFIFLRSSTRLLGFEGQGTAERLMGTQMEINKLLVTISRSINLVGVPRVFVENGSKIVKAHLNNEVGSIVTYQGTKPEYNVAPCVPAEIYAQLQRLIDYAYQQEGISQLASSSQKPAGLDSGAALREYDDLQSDRFASLNKRYDNMFVDLAYQIVDCAVDIVKKTGKYQTIYPNKDGVKEIDLPAAKELKNPFVIQCFDASALPKDPAGRKQEIVELIQSGMISLQEGRRLLDYPDLAQDQRLGMAGEERILKYLDMIVEDGKYTPPDPFMDSSLAHTLCVQYYNLYVAAGLEEDRAEMLRTFAAQCLALQQAAMPPQSPAQAPGMPQAAAPEALPTSPLIPNGNVA